MEILTVGMWAHVAINGMVCFSPTKNPIWGELRLTAVVVATAALWVVLAMVI